MPQHVIKILIIRYSSMGDVILVAPLISFFHEKYHHAEIALLTLEPYTHLFRNDTRLAFVYGVKKKMMCGSIGIDALWDIVIDLQNNRISRKQTSRLHCKVIHRFDKMHLKRNILLLFRIDLYRNVSSVAQRYIAATGEKTIPYDTLNFQIPFECTDDTALQQKIQRGEIDRPVIAFFPFSRWKNKEWPVSYFITVGRFFLIKGWNVVIMGGKADREKALKISTNIGERCTSLAGELDLHDCGCVIKKCSLALGCDTGLSHLARACGVKCGFVFGPTTRHLGFQPDDKRTSKNFESSLFCRPCHPHGGNICLRFDHACMRSVSPEKVINGLIELYHG